jgi:hypothetical protein
MPTATWKYLRLHLFDGVLADENCPDRSTLRKRATYCGGTERVVSYLTEELVRQGHDVTLFASGDSITAAKLLR